MRYADIRTISEVNVGDPTDSDIAASLKEFPSC